MAMHLTLDRAKVNKTKAPARALARSEKIAAALAQIDRGEDPPDCVTETPGAFLWEVYKVWLDQGGQDGGKNRNSIRRMRDTWLTGKHEVKSLHPKLSGRVRLSRRDAEALIWLFLTKWHYEPGDSHADEEGYIAFPSKEITELQRAVIAVIFAGQDGSGLLLPVRVNEVATEAILRGSDEVFRLGCADIAYFAAGD
jgi:hypothetical protein